MSAVPTTRPAMPLRLRSRIADAIERLIAALDALDEDVDLEEETDSDVLDEPRDGGDDDEPALGWTEHPDQTKAGETDPSIWFWSGEAEPGLGAPESPHDQRRWAQGDAAEVGYHPAGRPVNRYPCSPDRVARVALQDAEAIGKRVGRLLARCGRAR